ncbi:hypothetical protein COT47_07395, partial [Candidatus Woesearchaeota archaeon CG08_land_8_20_14_0_20_43_7]
GVTVRKELVVNIPALTSDNSTFSFRGPAKSANYYSKVCMKFNQINYDCFVGIRSGDEICNNVVDGKKSYESYQKQISDNGLDESTVNSGSGGSITTGINPSI